MRSTRYSLTARGRSTSPSMPAAHRQQFLGKGQRLDARALPAAGMMPHMRLHLLVRCGGREARTARTRFVQRAIELLRAPVGGVLGQHALARAARDARDLGVAAARARRARPRWCRATRISRPGVEERVEASHQSLSTGAPQAAASNSRPDGHQPFSRHGARA